MLRFDEILENDDLLDALWDMRFDECTPIQEQAIPAVLEGRDLLACAQTGTGKTAAYLLPVIDLLADGTFPKNAVNCVIMAPTRELAQQIDQQMQGFSYFLPISSMPIYGGTDGHTYEQQRKSLKAGADVVIATPGRLLAHLSMGYVDLSQVSFFILDEADRMLDMGFFDDIMQIVGRLPKERQTLLFSATMPPKIQQFAEKILNDPFEIKLAVSKPAEKICQSAYICYEIQKLGILRHIFKQTPPDKVIVFSSSKLKVKELTRAVRQMGIKVGEMHSDLDQTKREQQILDFKSGKINVLIATDIVSRGIDIDDIELVINYDVPREAEDYVHRVGRTARANRDGRAITFVSEKDGQRLHQIEKLLEKKVDREEIPSDLGPGPSENLKPERNTGKTKGHRKPGSSKRNRAIKQAHVTADNPRDRKAPQSISHTDNRKTSSTPLSSSTDTIENNEGGGKKKTRNRRRKHQDRRRNSEVSHQENGISPQNVENQK